MSHLEIAFESCSDTFSVRRAEVVESLSTPFAVTVFARCRSDDADLDAIVDRRAELTLETGLAFAAGPRRRRWVGVVERVEQLEAEPGGESLYQIHLAPRLAILAEREGHRLFQHLSIPEIADVLLAEWEIEPTWKIDRAAYPRLELRTQYGESDLAFLSRLLEEAGITYFFADAPERMKDNPLVLCDAPHAGEPRAGGPLTWVDEPSESAEREFATQVVVGRSLRSAKAWAADHDLRRPAVMRVAGGHGPLLAVGPEPGLERAVFDPGLALVEVTIDRAREIDQQLGTRPVGRGGPVGGGAPPAGVVTARSAATAGADAPTVAARVSTKYDAGRGPGDVLVGDDRGAARHLPEQAERRARLLLEAERVRRQDAQLVTNAVDVAPGEILSVEGHPHAIFRGGRRLLVQHLVLHGGPSSELRLTARLVPTDVPYRPERRTPRPAVHTVQSAIVVGPKGQEIHADELGRVRVQLPWDRQGCFDERSSCWMRVSQGWAGPGHGLFTVPRVGHEVLVAFLDGNPDSPVVVGRVHGGTTPVPHVLPDHKTRSALRTSSSPGGGGANELMFEDAKGKELLYLHAQRDAQEVVRRDRAATVGAVDSTLVGARHVVRMARSSTYVEMVDERITLTTGRATVTLAGATATFQASALVLLHAQGGDVVFEGGPDIKINCGGGPKAPKGGAAGGGGAPKPRRSVSSGARGKSGMDVDAAIAHLDENAGAKSKGKCARYVRKALQAGGAKLDMKAVPVREGTRFAEDYGPALEGAGFVPVADQGTMAGYAPQAGDVAVFASVPGHPYGHITMYDGTQWVSDFKQRSMYAARAYQGGDFTIYRP